MNNKKVVNIFGTKYIVHILNKPNKDMYENTWQGYCNFDSKEIFVLGNANNSFRIYVHELIHCFLNEAGHRELANDEHLVELFTEIAIRIMNRKEL